MIIDGPFFSYTRIFVICAEKSTMTSMAYATTLVEFATTPGLKSLPRADTHFVDPVATARAANTAMIAMIYTAFTTVSTG